MLIFILAPTYFYRYFVFFLKLKCSVMPHGHVERASLKILEAMRTPTYRITDSKNEIVTTETDSTLLGCLCVMRNNDISTLVISDDLLSIDFSQTSSLRVISMVDIFVYFMKLREKEIPTEIFTEFKVQNFIDDMKPLSQIPVFPSR